METTNGYKEVKESSTCCCVIDVKCNTDKVETFFTSYENFWFVFGCLSILGPVIAGLVWGFDQIGILKYRFEYENKEIGFTHTAKCWRSDVFLFTMGPIMFIVGIVAIRAVPVIREHRQNRVRSVTVVDAILQIITGQLVFFYFFYILFASLDSVGFNVPDDLPLEFKNRTDAYSFDGYRIYDKLGCG